MEDFERGLKQMTKPEIGELKHQDALNRAIIKAKDKSVLSWWWLAVPSFIILMLLMKSLYMPDTTLSSGLRDFTERNKILAYLFFIVAPVILILINAVSIKKVYHVEGRPEIFGLLRAMWLNITIVGLCITILLIYIL